MQEGSLNEPSEILPRLFLGSKISAENAETFQRCGISHVLNAAVEIPCFFSEGIAQSSSTPDENGKGPLTPKYLHLDLKDDPSDKVDIELFERCNQFLDEVLNGSGPQSAPGVLVHCQAGISRSAMLVIAYLMSRRSMSLREAFFLVKEKRPNVGPNETFFSKLQEYEEHLLRQRGTLTAGEEYRSSFDRDDYLIDTLCAMGFSQETAKASVKNSGGRFELAVEFCLTHSK
uniref:protein-tyrosine-phosphatase n=1 Tax=Chromera velia CCMP2878 TaxID=1169474 RepID=A0A0G4HDE9_9ALVE|eukprot:Cvel_6384.t1-p1 / transcript=Cvel_6384.t1 / gene=Cvel_6384 / organism=Chromera_velia_CCMP2878 / gene_product=MAP kinase phosphatase with leucine-rich repeats, putative / transcript_product=MAP kinase phosphatase with leucine-rich repeats, putative / location=Cvel_scaffold311:24380-25069(-) / protein_length=230 / sequence_SO=supercontig / SO=protein_coding / is_pseudo=false